MRTEQVKFVVHDPLEFNLGNHRGYGRDEFYWGGIVQLEFDNSRLGFFAFAPTDSREQSSGLAEDWNRRLRYAAGAAVRDSAIEVFDRNDVSFYLPKADTAREPDPWMIPVTKKYLSELRKSFAKYNLARESFRVAVERVRMYADHPRKLRFQNDASEMLDFLRRSLRAGCPRAGDDWDFRKLADIDVILGKLETRKDTTSKAYRELGPEVSSGLGFIRAPMAWTEAPPTLAPELVAKTISGPE